ncbi:hypothetical protein FBU59_006532, partial [Linderina macrospora]
LNKLHITGSAYVYTDIFRYFKGRDLENLTIMDDPMNFKNIKEPALERVKLLKVGHPTGTPFMSAYSIDMVEHLYNLPSNAEEAVIGLIQYPMPKMIAWDNLRSLRMSASIADKHGLANLLAQLPLLRFLFMDCFSMSKDDAAATKFPGQKVMLDRLGQVMDPDDMSLVSETLTHMEFFVQRTFDVHGFCELLARLPNANNIKINDEVMFAVMDTLEQVLGVKRPILFVPASM